MLSEKKRLQIAAFAKLKTKGNNRFHRMRHIRAVAAWATKLSAIERSDRDVCWIAAMLHDITKSEEGNHGTTGAKEARTFLLGIGVDKKIVDGVYDAIYFHNKEFSGGPIERQVLWDADKLDLLTFDSFRDRLCPDVKEAKGAKDFIKNLENEYMFFKKRVHTKEGKRIVKREEPAIMEYIDKRKTAMRI
jgi:hypothetical protein